MVEFALIAPLLLFLIMGAFELSVALRMANGVESASAAGARVTSQLGDEPLADYYTLDVIRSALGEVDGFTVTDVIVFEAGDPGRTTPPSACLGPPRDRVNSCNHYSASDLSSLSLAAFGQAGAGNTCDSNDLSRYFCPGADRIVDQSDGLTFVGVWIQGRRQSMSGLMPFMSETVSAATVMRVEPR